MSMTLIKWLENDYCLVQADDGETAVLSRTEYEKAFSVDAVQMIVDIHTKELRSGSSVG